MKRRLANFPNLQAAFDRLQEARNAMFEASRRALPDGTAVLAELKKGDPKRRVIVVGRSFDGATLDVKPHGAVLSSRVNLERVWPVSWPATGAAPAPERAAEVAS
jgi:hypothetical protein